MDATGKAPRRTPQGSAPCDDLDPLKRGGSSSVVLAKMYEHLSRRGRRYFVGRIGAVKVLMMETGNIDRGSPVWQICLEQGSQTTEHEIGLAREIAADDRAGAGQ
jgi:hypothetical protein